MQSTSVETKLRAARARLAMDKPFIGALVLHLPFEPARWCASIATDARRIYFNPEYIAALSLAETQFVLAHEAMHCALGHFARRSHRLRDRWDVACDYAVNALLVDEGLVAPKAVLLDPRFRALSAEEIYPLIGPETQARPLDTHLFEGIADAGKAGRAHTRSASIDSAQASDPSSSVAFSDDDTWSDAASYARRSTESGPSMGAALQTREALAQAWQMRLAAAAQQARLAGRLGASWQRAIGRLIAPKLPWRTVLARYLAQIARDDYSFQRPSRREGQALLPRLSSGQVEVFAVVDTSGSIGETELREFVAEIDALKGQVRARITLHACDAVMAAGGPWVAEAWEPMVWPGTLAGGGGTSFLPPFEWIGTQGLRPDVLIYFTDAEGTFPPLPPVYPVLWLVKGRGAVPWGERIQLN